MMCGDCRKVLPILPRRYRLVLTDPPYGDILAASWDVPGSITDEFCELLKPTLLPDASIYLWCGIGEKSRSLLDFIRVLDRHFYFKDLVTWKKRRGIGGRRGWLYTREEVLWYVVDRNRFFWNKDNQYSCEPNEFTQGMQGTRVHPTKRLTNVWTDIPEQLVKTPGTHPAAKPIQALERIILAHTEPGNWVLDPFAGSGSTLVACAKLDRNGTGIEIDPSYCRRYWEMGSSCAL